VVRAAAAPQLCDSAYCTSIDIWGKGTERLTYFRPRHGRDFMLIVFQTPAEARRMASFDRKAMGLGAATNSSTLLVYLKSSSRIAQTRAALTAIH
jgi:hypothetical protein